jgi:filamentous hemagglutinin
LTRTPQAPEIKYIDAQGRERAVRFDGLEGNVLIDRKRAVATTPKVRETIRRQSEALRQNGLSGRWEVPTAFDARRAQKLFDELGIKNITVKVVPE